MQRSSKNLILTRGLTIALSLLLSACSNYLKPIDDATLPAKVASLTKALIQLDKSVLTEEAKSVAEIAVYYPVQLRQEYKLVDSPLVHNALVNSGIKERGLCIHWTEDLLEKLSKLNLSSLNLNWIVANQTENFRLEHSAVLVSAILNGHESGVVLDPWRNSGEIYFSKLLDDSYQWKIHYNDITSRLLFSK